MSKKMQKMIVPTVVMMALLAVGIYGVSQVSADDLSSYPPIVERLADKFGLNVADVEEVFIQERSEHHEMMRQTIEERLNQAVADGKITEEQKNALLAKRDEMQADREAEREEHRAKMQKWFEDQGIDPEVLAQYGGFAGGFRMGFHKGFMMGH